MYDCFKWLLEQINSVYNASLLLPYSYVVYLANIKFSELEFKCKLADI